MQAELGLLQQAVEIHGLVLAFHRSQGGLVRAAIQVSVSGPEEAPQATRAELEGGLVPLP